jgi:DNA-directed RNA polymerase specialized sigma subunit
MKKAEKHERYYLTGADGREHEVSEEIFRAYKHSVWNEEAQYKRERSVIRDKDDRKSELDKKEYLRVSSIESIAAGGGEHHLGETPDFSEELVEALEEKELLELLGQALEILEEPERELVTRLFYENISEREYERKYGTPRKTLAYRRDKVLGKLRDFMVSRR